MACISGGCATVRALDLKVKGRAPIAFARIREGLGGERPQPEDRPLLRRVLPQLHFRELIRTRRPKLLFLGILFAFVALPLMVPMVFAAEALTDHDQTGIRGIARAMDYLFATVFTAFAVRILTVER